MAVADFDQYLRRGGSGAVPNSLADMGNACNWDLKWTQWESRLQQKLGGQTTKEKARNSQRLGDQPKNFMY